LGIKSDLTFSAIRAGSREQGKVCKCRASKTGL
jgi:hypothetical protein